MENRIRHARTHITRNEDLIFERTSPGKTGVALPPLDVPSAPAEQLLGADFHRDNVEGFPEVSELDVIRHFTRLSTWNYGVDTGLYPLGSCTMKYNPKVNEETARLPGFAFTHPLQPVETIQGNLAIMYQLQQWLKTISGFSAVSLQPSAGAQGEMTGVMMICAYHH
jgi:glycine dehydrogenase subunit 2